MLRLPHLQLVAAPRTSSFVPLSLCHSALLQVTFWGVCLSPDRHTRSCAQHTGGPDFCASASLLLGVGRPRSSVVLASLPARPAVRGRVFLVGGLSREPVGPAGSVFQVFGWSPFSWSSAQWVSVCDLSGAKSSPPVLTVPSVSASRVGIFMVPVSSTVGFIT